MIRNTRSKAARSLRTEQKPLKSTAVQIRAASLHARMPLLTFEKASDNVTPVTEYKFNTTQYNTAEQHHNNNNTTQQNNRKQQYKTTTQHNNTT